MTGSGGGHACGEVRERGAPWQREAAGVKRSILTGEAEKGVWKQIWGEFKCPPMESGRSPMDQIFFSLDIKSYRAKKGSW